MQPSPPIAPEADASLADASDRDGASAQSSNPLISVVAPVYCEQATIAEFYRRAKDALAALAPAMRHEIIFVNDGSTDGSLGILLGIAERDPRVRVIDLSRNFGHQTAITAGIDHAAGDAVVVMDADLQDPPERIADMVRLWREGYRVVYGVRRARKGESVFKRATAGVFYRILSRLSDIPIPLDSGDFRLMDRAVVDVLKDLREESRYIRGLVSWVGFRQTPLHYDRDPRHAGETKFSLRRMLGFAFDGISSFSDKPLRVASHLGTLVTIGSLLLMLWIIVGKILYPNRSETGWTSMMAAVLFLGGVQLISIGLLGEYIGRIFRQAKSRPLYVVARRVNFNRASEATTAKAEAQSAGQGS